VILFLGSVEGDSMRPKERRDSWQSDLFKARLDQIVDLKHPLAKLARTVDWRFLEERFGAVYSDGSGHPTRWRQRHGRREARRPALGEPACRRAHRRGQAGRLCQSRCQHDSATQGGCVPERRNPHDGHTLVAVIPDIETQIGVGLSRIVGDRGHLSAMRRIVARPQRAA